MSAARKLVRPAAPRYLRLRDLRALRHLVFSTRRPVSGLYAGRHASPQRGHSVEFSDYREYTPGDELGDIDWKVYARSDRLVVKLFEHQTDMGVHLLVDGSSSMAYRGLAPPRGPRRAPGERHKPKELPPSKYDQACLLAAAVAFLTLKQQDRVAFGVAREGLQSFLPAHGAFPHLRAVLAAMEAHTPEGERGADLAAALDTLSRRVSRKGLLVVFTDLLEDMEPILRALSIFTHRGNEVIVFHVLHPDELRLPDTDETLFVDSETGAELRLHVADARPLYEARVRAFLDGWAAAFRARGIDYKPVRTDEPFHQALEGYLFRRAATR